MSKNGLYLVVALALAVTAATFFVSKPGKAATCSTQVVVDTQSPAVSGGPIVDKTARSSAHGYPLWYYQEPLAEGCLPAHGAAAGGFNAGHLGDDFLIWLAAVSVSYIALAWSRSLRDRPMLGYGKESEHV